MSDKSDFAVKILKQYAEENQLPPRSTSDLSKLEEWLIIQLMLSQKHVNMRYLITTKETYSPFLTGWFEPENHFNADLDMTVYDLVERKYTNNGKVWHPIENDTL